MAKKKAEPVKINKTQAIRDYLASNPEAKPQEVHEALTGQGVEASLTYVQNRISSLKNPGGGIKCRSCLSLAGGHDKHGSNRQPV